MKSSNDVFWLNNINILLVIVLTVKILSLQVVLVIYDQL